MDSRYYHSGKQTGFQYGKPMEPAQSRRMTQEKEIQRSTSDEDLIIEDNTVYEIDRECYNRLRRKRKKEV